MKGKAVSTEIVSSFCINSSPHTKPNSEYSPYCKIKQYLAFRLERNGESVCILTLPALNILFYFNAFSLCILLYRS